MDQQPLSLESSLLKELKLIRRAVEAIAECLVCTVCRGSGQIVTIENITGILNNNEVTIPVEKTDFCDCRKELIEVLNANTGH